MIKKIKQLLTAASVSLAVFVPVLATTVVSAGPAINDNLACGTNFDANLGGCNSDTSQGTGRVNSLIEDVVNIFSLVVGVISVIMIIVGGFRYITSGGESNSVGSAKNTILYAIIGLVIVALAQFIVQFVLGRVTD